MTGERDGFRGGTMRRTGRTWRLTALAAAVLSIPIAGAVGCGAKPESMEEQFPTLVRYAGWNEQKLTNYVNAAGSGNPATMYDLTMDNLPSMPVGAQIDVMGSRFATSSIFDIWVLHKNGLLDQDPSQSVAESTIILRSNSQASTSSSRQQKNYGLSVGGLVKKLFFKASFQHQSDHATQNQTQ
ncbi:MAG: hypothetical protein WCS72_18015, partial [Deltaproteobacteria bacterium]